MSASSPGRAEVRGSREFSSLDSEGCAALCECARDMREIDRRAKEGCFNTNTVCTFVDTGILRIIMTVLI